MNDYRIDGLTIREHFQILSNKGNKKFTEELHPGVENILGLRTPDLRALGARIAKNNWRGFLANADTFYMEERMLIGMVIGNVKINDVDEYLKLVDSFVKVINSWSVCDSFDFKGKRTFVEKNEERVWNYLNNYMEADGEYEIRFGIVRTQAYFVNHKYVEPFLQKLFTITHQGYYVKMAIAWALSICYVKFPEITLKYLQRDDIDGDILRKSIQKICDSYRVPKEEKASVRLLRSHIKE